MNAKENNNLSRVKDEFQGILVGDMIFFVGPVWCPDHGDLVARRGDIGHVLSKGDYSAPTVQCERTGRVFDALPGYDFEVLAPVAFASSPETTPGKPLRTFIRRGRA